MKPGTPGQPEHFEPGKGWVDATPDVPAETTTFKDLQEARSNLIQDIADENRMVKMGKTPRYDLEKMYDKLNDIDATMDKAAMDQGGEAAVNQLHAARAQYKQYMDDFHNFKSPLRNVLNMSPDDTKGIVNHFKPGDLGNRALDALERNGVDTNDIRQLYQEGVLPNTVTTNEAAKLKAAGSDKNYKIMRYNEGIRQTQKSNLQSSANETLPSNNLRSQPPSIVGEVPLASKLSPKAWTRMRLKTALENLGKPDEIPAGSKALKAGRTLGKVQNGQVRNDEEDQGPSERAQHVALHTAAIQTDLDNEQGGEPAVPRGHIAALVAGYNNLSKKKK